MDLKIGDPVTIVTSPENALMGAWILLACLVASTPQPARHGIVYFDTKPLDGSHGRLRRFDTEGVWWCRGHSGEAVRALEVAMVLR